MANTNGPGITVDRVRSRGGGRGVFCVSNSRGPRIITVDLASNGNNSILIENCSDITVGACHQVADSAFRRKRPCP